MSYLVDALKKAERERHENQRADLRSLAGGGPASGHGGSALRWLVGLLIACNALRCISGGIMGIHTTIYGITAFS